MDSQTKFSLKHDTPQTSSPGAERPEAATTVRDTGIEIARLLIQDGFLSEEQLAYALRVRAKLSSKRPLLGILKEMGYITEEQQRQTLGKHRVSIQLGGLLVELGYLREADLRAALAIQKEAAGAKKLGEILLDNHFIEEYRLIEVLANQLGFPYIEPNLSTLDRKILERVHPGWCRRHHLLPVRSENGRILVAFADPQDRKARQEAEQIFGNNLVPLFASKRVINEVIRAYERSSHRAGEQSAVLTETSVIELVNTLILESLRARASDIHIEPLKDQLRIRFRCDGVLIIYKVLDKNLAPALSNRIKVLAKADIAEKRHHQDGRILFEEPGTGRQVDIRASFYVTIHGEKIVLRLLQKAQLVALDELGIAPRVLAHFYQDALDVPTGVILITGPTGTGKTTTLYSCVDYLNSIDRSIITAEDPVEYVIEGISQCSLNPRIDLTYENSLPYIVRQDPDVIVLGEIRDQFSAEAAIQAALTGHKVLTTFHTEDTIGGLLRLMNMDIETFLISSTVVSVLSQRLLRRVCPDCAEPYLPSPLELQRLGYGSVDLQDASFRQGGGCSQCRFTGYRGRLGVFELLILNVMVKDAILQKKTSHELRRISLETSGMVTLLEEGIAKAARGETTLSQVFRQLPQLDRPRPLDEIRRLTGL